MKSGTASEGAGEQHLGGDLDAEAVVGAGGSLHDAGDGVELAAHLLHHGQRSLAHALHGHCAEPVREHGAHQQTSKDLQQVKCKPVSKRLLTHANNQYGCMQGLRA